MKLPRSEVAREGEQFQHRADLFFVYIGIRHADVRKSADRSYSPEGGARARYVDGIRRGLCVAEITQGQPSMGYAGLQLGRCQLSPRLPSAEVSGPPLLGARI